MIKHEKHAKIAKANFGKFSRNEISILGTPCGNIKKLAYTIIEELSSKYKIGYVDADHKGADEEGISIKSSLNHNANLEYVDKIHFNRFDTLETINEYQFKQYFNAQDLVIVNGNHFEAKYQVVVIDSKKPVEKKLAKLTNVELIIFQEGEKEIPVYIKKHLPNIGSIPSYRIEEIDKIVDFFESKNQTSIAPIKGLVLAGGKSMRMQKDKGKIDYHGKEQRMFMYELLDQIAVQPFMSIRPDQSNELDKHVNKIEDKFFGLGPYGAILSAFQDDPNTAWLVTACDQPFLDKKTLGHLISKRNPSKFATAFYNPDTEFPEPLITIWEPRAYPQLLHFLGLGYSCPRKVLINSDIELVKLENASVLKNANTPAEYEDFSSQIN